jgi:hypothetical protein
MTEPIEFLFDVVSPFGWFSAERSAACRARSKLLCVPEPKRDRIGDEVRQACCVNL